MFEGFDIELWNFIKSNFSKKATKIWKNLPNVWCYWVKKTFCQNKWEIFSKFVAFLQCLNFNQRDQNAKVDLAFYGRPKLNDLF